MRRKSRGAVRRRLIIVANRLPVHRVASGRRARWESSAGGLVTAMAPVLERFRGTWVGWTGVAGAKARPFTHDGLRLSPVSISDAEIDSYYHGVSNRAIWPLYHDAIRPPQFDQRHWEPYVEVNRRFARAVAATARRGDSVWVHDYHLQLVPQMLREFRPDLRIGFFMHIPFPPEELFAWLPWRTQIAAGLLGADLIGFQTYAAAQNYSRAARRYTDAEGTDTELVFGGRRIAVGSFPISIDFKALEAMASSEAVLREAQQIRRNVGTSRKLILSVDRLDYTKGIDLRLLAFEQLLRRRIINVDDCVLLQIAVPSRERVREYTEMRTRIEQIVGRINGEFSAPGRVAVHYFRRSIPRDELAAYYRAADVMLVTPLRDGMNLVAKEYVATRTDHTGTLVLSEFAGAARELRQALLVNPHDLEAMIQTIARALTVPKKEAKQRMVVLRTVVRRHDVYFWADEFLKALNT